MTQKEGFRRRLSRLFSKSEGNLSQRERGENGPGSVGIRDAQDGRGERKKRSRERKAFRRTRGEEEEEASVYAAQSTEPPTSRVPQKEASKVHGLSSSEPDLWRNGLLHKFGSLAWHKRRSRHLEFREHLVTPTDGPWPLGRLHRPAVGSNVDMRNRSGACPSGIPTAEQERPDSSPQPSKTDSAGTSLAPSAASFDSVLCWEDGTSWDSAFSVTNSSLYGPTFPQMKDDTFKLPSEQQETCNTLESFLEWAQRLFTGDSHPTATGELENLDFSSSLGESVSGHSSGAEGSRAATPCLHREGPLAVGDAAVPFKTTQTKTATKFLYEILITLTKEKEGGLVDAEPVGCGGEKECQCHSPRDGTLSLRFAELQKKGGQRHWQEPARPAPQLSELKEFQNCTEPHGVGTFEAGRLIRSPATGSQVTPQWGSTPGPGQHKDQSATVPPQSGDGPLAKGTGTVAPASPTDSFSESHQISLATYGKEVQLNRRCSTGHDWGSIQPSMEKVTGGSRSSQGRAGGSVSGSSFSWKKAAPDLAKEEVKSSPGKRSAVAHGVEKGAPRASSPSRVSALLEAWEKGLVGTEPATQPSSATTRCSRSPVHTSRLLSSKDASRSLSPANAKSPFPLADTKRSPFPANTKQSHSSAEARQTSSLADTKPFFSLADSRRCLSPPDRRQSPSPVDTKRAFSPADTRRSRSPADARRSPSLVDSKRSYSPAEMRRSLSPADTRRSPSSSGTRQSRSASEVRQYHSPAETRPSCFQPYSRSPSPSARAQSSSSPRDKQRSSSPADLQCSSLPDIRQSVSSARRSSSVADIKQRFCPTDTRHPSPPADDRSSSPCSSAGSRSFSPPSDGRRSRSLSPRRDSTAHGPVFSQVYFPGSKPNNLVGTESQDTNSTGMVRFQGENHCYDATNVKFGAGGPKENHTSNMVGSQKDNLPTSVSARVAQFQNENCVPNTPASSAIKRPLKRSRVTGTTIVKSQTESYLSRTAGRAVGNKPSSGPPVMNPGAHFIGSGTVLESQTQWFNSKGDRTVVFKSEREVVVPKGTSGTVYRAGQEVIMHTSGPGRVSKSQQERGLVPNTPDSVARKENHQQPWGDLTDAKSPKLSLNGICNGSPPVPQPQHSMTQPRSAGVNDAQRQRSIPAPSPAITSDGDATTCGEGAVRLSTPHSDCSIHNKAVFQKDDIPVAANKSTKVGSMPDSGGPKARGSNQESSLSRGEKVTASGFKITWCTSGAGGTAGENSVVGNLLGSQRTAPEDQKVTTQTGPKKGQRDSAKDGLIFAYRRERDFSHDPLSEETGSNNTTTEEEPEESVDMELFVDTLRNMEPPELRKPLKIHSRSPRPSTFAKQAALPPIHEYRITPKSKVPLPTALDELFALSEERISEKELKEDINGFAEEMEEVENPYLTEDEKSQANNQTKKLYPWENKPYKTEEEIGAFLGKLKQAPEDFTASKAIMNQTNLIRANVLKGASLLCGFVDKKATEDKPYSRLDGSLLYSKFITPEKIQFKVLEKGKDGINSPGLPMPTILKVNRERQTSLNGPQVGANGSQSSESSRAGFQVPSSSRTPVFKISSNQVPLLSKGGHFLPQSKFCLESQRNENRVLKINMRPGKIILYTEADFGGEKREIWGDIIDASSWDLSHTISVQVIRGGWVMYEKPRFHGRKCVLAEGNVEITNPWKMYHEEGEEEVENTSFRIGSLKRVVRDYRIPEISLFMEENGEGPKQRFTDSSEDLRVHGQALKAASIIVHSGLWLVYSKPFFDDDPYVLEPGGYPNLQAWGAKDSSVCSMHPIKLGCPVVEKPGEPKAMIYERPNFQDHCWEVSRDIYSLKKLDNSEDYPMATMGSLKIVGGCWVGYEKEGFRGHQYLLEEGEYPDWSQWGGYNKQLVSLRLIRTDFLDPALLLFEAMDFEEGRSVELNEALPDVELAGYGTTTQSIHVLGGVWVAYEDKNFSGEQYILEKGVYHNSEDWGAGNCQISSVQPILQVGEHSLHFISLIQLFSGPDFTGAQLSFKEDQSFLPDIFIPRSCRVYRGSWILYDSHHFEGEQHVISEGEYPTLSSMGCLSATAICSLKKVPLYFSEPSVFLHGLECFEGKEIELNSEVRSLQAEGFNNHVLSVRVKGGIWVLCEHSDFRGRQWLLDCVEITNWPTYSGLQHVGSLYPIRQRRVYFRMKNAELKSFLCVPEDVEDMKAGRVLVSELNDRSSFLWYYEEGLLKNQIAPGMSLQVIGPAKIGAKVVLWSETRMPRQTWRIDSLGRICSQMFENMIVDVKGGQAYDQDHAVLSDSSDDRPTQIWDIQVL